MGIYGQPFLEIRGNTIISMIVTDKHLARFFASATFVVVSNRIAKLPAIGQA
jgi:hypothetical protein